MYFEQNAEFWHAVTSSCMRALKVRLSWLAGRQRQPHWDQCQPFCVVWLLFLVTNTLIPPSLPRSPFMSMLLLCFILNDEISLRACLFKKKHDKPRRYFLTLRELNPQKKEEEEL